VSGSLSLSVSGSKYTVDSDPDTDPEYGNTILHAVALASIPEKTFIFI
jgi:hypothetical protein